eukprot:TRINITY_DN536_c0_g1_i1.p1 TRINITY_DN536_c0_g1~~TRINITY_DN536_c0_g1_i1.p1  ORF type:complete len:173 (+),score=33.33 TRINITY_DN536_c0_g1_i1:280-798(+)
MKRANSERPRLKVSFRPGQGVYALDESVIRNVESLQALGQTESGPQVRLPSLRVREEGKAGSSRGAGEEGGGENADSGTTDMRIDPRDELGELGGEGEVYEQDIGEGEEGGSEFVSDDPDGPLVFKGPRLAKSKSEMSVMLRRNMVLGTRLGTPRATEASEESRAFGRSDSL